VVGLRGRSGWALVNEVAEAQGLTGLVARGIPSFDIDRVESTLWLAHTSSKATCRGSEFGVVDGDARDASVVSDLEVHNDWGGVEDRALGRANDSNGWGATISAARLRLRIRLVERLRLRLVERLRLRLVERLRLRLIERLGLRLVERLRRWLSVVWGRIYGHYTPGEEAGEQQR